MRTRYLHRPAPLNVAHVAATLYRDDDPAEPVADVYDRRAVLRLVGGVCPCGPPVDSLLLATPARRPTPYRVENLARSNFSQETHHA